MSTVRFSLKTCGVALLASATGAAGAVPTVHLLGHHETGKQPTSVTLLEDGSRLAVTNRGDRSVQVHDTATMEIVEQHSLIGHHGAWDCAEAAPGRLLVSNWTGETLSILDRASGEVTGHLVTGIKPSYVAVSADRRRAYAAGYLSGDVAILDLENGETRRILEVGQKPMGVAVSSDARWLYVAVCRSGKIARIDLKHEVVLDNFRASLAETTNLVLTPDDRHLLAAGADDRLLVIDAESGRTTRIKVGAGPAAVAVTPDGTVAFVAQHDGGSIGVVDLAEGVMADTVEVGTGCLSVATDGKRLYSCSDLAASVSAFELQVVAPADIPPAE